MNKRNVIVHAHIFKNAGSSFDDSLLHHFKDAFVDHREDHLIMHDKNFFEKYLCSNITVAAFSSHSVYHTPKNFDNTRIFTVYFLRHPIERIRSVFSFEKKQPETDSLGAKMAKQLDFIDYVAWRMQKNVPITIRNLQTVFLAGIGPQAINMEHKYELALQKINASNLIGIVDRYDESMVVFEDYLKEFFPGIDLSYIRRNVTDVTQLSVEEKSSKLLLEFGEQLAAEVLANNEYDLELYTKANEKLSERIKNIDEFEQKLSDFQMRCFIKKLQELINLGEYDEVKQLTYKEIERGTQEIHFYLMNAKSLQLLNEFPIAIQEYKNIILRFPDNPWAYFLIAETYWMAGDFEKAKSYLNFCEDKFSHEEKIIKIFRERCR